MKKQSDVSKIKIQPLADRVLVKRLDSEDKKSPAGIIIPDTAQKEKSKIGLVVAVGPGKYGDEGDLIPMSVKVGQRVLFSKYGPNEIKIDDKEYLIAKEEDILAIIE